ncbi:hypothetical protein TEA_010666 [Camellia sinensis var. sinensis]|uniref:Uncharacterized protein n=1 Tax=Camellia sinensis var. sinensis TaxID=542762 RepID=A0A4S4E4B4_CAMSN|nr:hypothetical protein TEA_010666 [Camellia sinensis var. sinensis]
MRFNLQRSEFPIQKQISILSNPEQHVWSRALHVFIVVHQNLVQVFSFGSNRSAQFSNNWKKIEKEEGKREWREERAPPLPPSADRRSSQLVAHPSSQLVRRRLCLFLLLLPSLLLILLVDVGPSTCVVDHLDLGLILDFGLISLSGFASFSSSYAASFLLLLVLLHLHLQKNENKSPKRRGFGFEPISSSTISSYVAVPASIRFLDLDVKWEALGFLEYGLNDVVFYHFNYLRHFICVHFMLDKMEKWEQKWFLFSFLCSTSLLDGIANTGMVELGEVQLATYFAEKTFTRQHSFQNGLPSLIAFPSGCNTANCLIRYKGELSVDAVTNWFATTILSLPRILYYSKDSLVKVIFFSETGERTAPFVRQATLNYWPYVAFAFLPWREEESSFWWNVYVSIGAQATSRQVASSPQLDRRVLSALLAMYYDSGQGGTVTVGRQLHNLDDPEVLASNPQSSNDPKWECLGPAPNVGS